MAQKDIEAWRRCLARASEHHCLKAYNPQVCALLWVIASCLPAGCHRLKRRGARGSAGVPPLSRTASAGGVCVWRGQASASATVDLPAGALVMTYTQQLVKGLYAAFVPYWRAVWPADQLMFLRTEDYKQASVEHVQAVADFLGACFGGRGRDGRAVQRPQLACRGLLGGAWARKCVWASPPCWNSLAHVQA